LLPNQVGVAADANEHSIGRAKSGRHLIYLEYSIFSADISPIRVAASGHISVRGRTVLARLLIGAMPMANELIGE